MAHLDADVAAVGRMCSRCDVTSVDALALLSQLGASPWLVRHHELVLEAAVALCDELARQGVALDRSFVLAGAALHDVGKIVHPEEQHAPGHEHEAAGQALLGEAGILPQLAHVCVTHASWDEPDRTLEDLVIALADKLWKGKRVDHLERLVVAVSPGPSVAPSGTYSPPWRQRSRRSRRRGPTVWLVPKSEIETSSYVLPSQTSTWSAARSPSALNV